MKTESQMPGTLLDFLRKWGAMQGLFSNNAKVQTSLAVRDILRQYCIDDMQSEPLQQNQNPAEQHIQDVKSMTSNGLHWCSTFPLAALHDVLCLCLESSFSSNP